MEKPRKLTGGGVKKHGKSERVAWEDLQAVIEEELRFRGDGRPLVLEGDDYHDYAANVADVVWSKFTLERR